MQRPKNLAAAKHWLACYVMISRAIDVDGFLVLRPATRKEVETRPPQYLLDELRRLEELEEQSLPRLLEYIQNLPTELPQIVQDVIAPDAVQKETMKVTSAR